MALLLAFLQARMGSCRLPGKVLLRIQGRSILERAIGRLRATRTLDGVVVVTTTLEEDDAIAVEARMLGVSIYRGPELDVLKRFQEAAERFGPDIVVRATSDNPLVDIASVDRIVREVRAGNLDYCMENDLPVGAATEAITRRALKRLNRLAQAPEDREHVTTYLKKHPEKFHVAFLTPPDTLRRPDLRLTVDTPEDFVFVESLIKGVPETGYPVDLEQYLQLASSLSRMRV